MTQSPIQPPKSDPRKWDDLRPRVLSALVMVALGALEIGIGGASFAAFVMLLCGAMLWELARMTNQAKPRQAVLAGAIGLLALLAAIVMSPVFSEFGLMGLPPPPPPEGVAPHLLPPPEMWLPLLVPVLFIIVTERQLRLQSGLYALAIMLACLNLVCLRQIAGATAILWLVGVVITSDVAGYFAGRILGGPKFWPAISPKKTWSGTVAGWIGALAVGVIVMPYAASGWLIVAVSPLVAFAGQMGDIAESWFKRRTGFKDSSQLIPGHGGVLDRFDAMIGASLIVMALGLFLPPLI